MTVKLESYREITQKLIWAKFSFFVLGYSAAIQEVLGAHLRRHDIQYNDIEHNDTQHNYITHYTQYNNIILILMVLSIAINKM